MEAEDIESGSHWLVQGAVMALTKLKTEFEEDTSEKIKSEFAIGNVSEDLLLSLIHI